MVRVIVESPYAGDVERNLRYLRACMADCLRRAEAPFASHALYTQPGVLDDTVPEERALGMEAGFAWGQVADRVVVYTDLGMSQGMRDGVARAELRGTPVEYRSLPEWAPKPVRWEDEPSHSNDLETLRAEFRERLYQQRARGDLR